LLSFVIANMYRSRKARECQRSSMEWRHFSVSFDSRTAETGQWHHSNIIGTTEADKGNYESVDYCVVLSDVYINLAVWNNRIIDWVIDWSIDQSIDWFYNGWSSTLYPMPCHSQPNSNTGHKQSVSTRFRTVLPLPPFTAVLVKTRRLLHSLLRACLLDRLFTGAVFPCFLTVLTIVLRWQCCHHFF